MAVVNTNNLNPATTTMFTINVGDVVKICRPAGYPYLPPGSTYEEGVTVDKNYELNGFEILDRNLGKFIRTNNTQSNSMCVYYKHEKSGKQVIQYSANGSVVPINFFIVVQGITVHDHASIYMGGPAFATYFAETPREE